MTVIQHDATVVIACHTTDRWHSILRAIESIRAQSTTASSIVIAVDHNTRLVDRLAEIGDIVVVPNDSQVRGASATRNAGANAATTPLIAFLDDDEVAAADWLTLLLEPFGLADVVGTGGKYRPNWLCGKPNWFPDEFAWVVGGSFTGMPTVLSRVRNVWSGNMAVRTAAFRAVGGFRGGFGKVAGRSRPEDTDLCVRMAAWTGGHWVYVPAAIIEHEVPADRASLRFFLRRSFAEGRGKIEMSRHLGLPGTLTDESSYIRKTIPRGFMRELTSPMSGLPRAGAMTGGVIAAGAGAAVAVGSNWLACNRIARRSTPIDTCGASSPEPPAAEESAA